MDSYTVGVIIGALAVGFVCGLIPALIFANRGRNSMAVICLICCLVAGFILGLIAALPTAIGFTILALALPKEEMKINR